MHYLDMRFRVKACCIHLTASLAIGIVLAGLVFGIWYPGYFRQMSGGTELFIIVTSVDITMGPLITLVIANSHKKRQSLIRDFSVVVLMQLGALTYGVYMVSIVRPVILALEDDRFRVVAYNNVYTAELPLAPSGLRTRSLSGPQVVYSPIPTNPQLKSEALLLGFRGYDIGTRPSLWISWNKESRDHAVSVSKPISLLVSRYPNRRLELDAFIQKTHTSPNILGYIPMITFRGDWVALLDKNSGEIVGFAPFDGF